MIKIKNISMNDLDNTQDKYHQYPQKSSIVLKNSVSGFQPEITYLQPKIMNKSNYINQTPKRNNQLDQEIQETYYYNNNKLLEIKKQEDLIKQLLNQNAVQQRDQEISSQLNNELQQFLLNMNSDSSFMNEKTIQIIRKFQNDQLLLQQQNKIIQQQEEDKLNMQKQFNTYLNKAKQEVNQFCQHNTKFANQTIISLTQQVDKLHSHVERLEQKLGLFQSTFMQQNNTLILQQQFFKMLCQSLNILSPFQNAQRNQAIIVDQQQLAELFEQIAEKSVLGSQAKSENQSKVQSERYAQCQSIIAKQQIKEKQLEDDITQLQEQINQLQLQNLNNSMRGSGLNSSTIKVLNEKQQFRFQELVFDTKASDFFKTSKQTGKQTAWLQQLNAQLNQVLHLSIDEFNKELTNVRNPVVQGAEGIRTHFRSLVKKIQQIKTSQELIRIDYLLQSGE